MGAVHGRAVRRESDPLVGKGLMLRVPGVAGWNLPWPGAQNAFLDRIVSLSLDLRWDLTRVAVAINETGFGWGQGLVSAVDWSPICLAR